jgi:hypothetical protein
MACIAAAALRSHVEDGYSRKNIKYQIMDGGSSVLSYSRARNMNARHWLPRFTGLAKARAAGKQPAELVDTR